MRRGFVLYLALGLTTAWGSTALADSVETSTSAGPGIFSEDGIYHGLSSALRDSGNGPEWTVDAGYSRASDSVPKKPPVVDITRSLTGTLGEEQNAWRFGASYLVSNTPAESLVGDGPTIYLGHTWDGSGNRPSFDLKGRYTALNYRLDSPTGALSLGQNEAHLGATVSWSWISLYGGYGNYQYRHSVSRFNGALRSPKAVRALSGALRSALYGFPTQTIEGGLTISPNDRWQITLNETRSDTLVPRGTVYSTQLLAGHEFGRWEIDVGAERDLDVQFNQNMGLLNVTYRFDE